MKAGYPPQALFHAYAFQGELGFVPEKEPTIREAGEAKERSEERNSDQRENAQCRRCGC